MKHFYRVVLSLVLCTAVLATLFLGGLSFFTLVASTALLGTYEFCKIAEKGGHHPSLIVSSILSLGFIVAAYNGTELTSLVLGIGLLSSVLWLKQTEQPHQKLLSDLALTFFAGIYTGGILQYLILIRNLPDGVAWNLITLTGTWTCDFFGYQIGSRWGRHKLAPFVSPAKTWEGALAAVIFGFVVIVPSGYFLKLPLLHVVILAVLIPIGAILGDLTESLIKRTSGVKDSGGFLPGHGGMLDRIDGLSFALVLMYSYLLLTYELNR